jgi:GTP-binding protein
MKTAAKKTSVITAPGQALVAIVGEPNVGKSTILNRLVSERAALVSGVAGTTRDRFYADTVWNGVGFTLIDTAGIVLEERDELEKNVQKQVKIALSQADLLLYVVDGKAPPSSVNKKILQDIRRQKKPVLLLVNKVDSPKQLAAVPGSYAHTGIKTICPMSAVSGLGIGDMLDEVARELEALGFGTADEHDDGELSVAIVGKPNVGKSSLFNAILGEERVVVSPVPGTTRNVIDTVVEYSGKKIKFLDTAGLKRHEKRAPLPDVYAAFQTIRAMHRADICLFVIDAREGITQQDQKIAGEIIEAGKGLAIAVNKIDLLSEKERELLERTLAKFFPFLWWAPVVPISAKSGDGVNDLLDYILKIDENRQREIDPEVVRAFFKAKLKLRQPQRIRDERVPKVFSLAQIRTAPPVFQMVVNRPSAISMQFRKFIQNALTKEMNFWGTPVILRLEEKAGNPAKDEHGN